MRVTLGLVFLFVGMCLCHAEKADKTFLSFKKYPPAQEKRCWGYGKCIVAFKEAPLADVAKDCDSIYRLIYCPTFLPPYVITVSRKGTDYTIQTKQGSGMGGYALAGVAVETRGQMNLRSVRDFFARLEKSDFWHMRQAGTTVGIDGVDCVLEVVENGRYRYVYRGYFEDDDATFLELINWMVSQAPKMGTIETSIGGGVSTADSGLILDSGKPATTSSKARR